VPHFRRTRLFATCRLRDRTPDSVAEARKAGACRSGRDSLKEDSES